MTRVLLVRFPKQTSPLADFRIRVQKKISAVICSLAFNQVETPANQVVAWFNYRLSFDTLPRVFVQRSVPIALPLGNFQADHPSTGLPLIALAAPLGDLCLRPSSERSEPSA